MKIYREMDLKILFSSHKRLEINVGNITLFVCLFFALTANAHFSDLDFSSANLVISGTYMIN